MLSWHRRTKSESRVRWLAHPRFGKVPAQLVLAPSCFVDGHAPSGDEIPSCPAEMRSDRAGISPHSSSPPPGIPVRSQACLVSFFRNAVQRPLPLRISELLVGDEVAEINAGVVSLDYASLNSCFHVA